MVTRDVWNIVGATMQTTPPFCNARPPEFMIVHNPPFCKLHGPPQQRAAQAQRPADFSKRHINLAQGRRTSVLADSAKRACTVNRINASSRCLTSGVEWSCRSTHR
jgi:hypothetical protein